MVDLPQPPVVEFSVAQKEGTLMVVMNMEMPKRYLNVDEVASYLAISKKAVYRLVDARSIPFTKPGGLDILRFDLKALDKWMEKQSIPAKPLPA